METEILTSNYQPPPPFKDRLAQKVAAIKSKLALAVSGLKSPKSLTIITLVIAAVVVMISFMALQNRSPKTSERAPQAEVQVPKVNSTPTVSTINQNVNQFISKLEDNQGFTQKLSKPIVDLDLSFQKE